MFIRDRRGSTALEFSLISIPCFMLLFGIFDIGRYEFTVHSLRNLASETARAVMISCYANNVIHNQSPATCTTVPSSVNGKKIAPILYAGGASPTITISAAATAPFGLTVKVQQVGFKLIVGNFFGSVASNFNDPYAQVVIPY